MVTVTCPYCGEEFEEEVEHITEDEQYETECQKCEKVFAYSISIEINAYSCKLPCGGRDGDGPHEWKQRIGWPKEYFENKFYCIHCDLEKEGA